MTYIRLYLTAFALFLSAASAQAGNCTQPANVYDMATGIATGLNQSRRANGLSVINFNRQLGVAAQAQACDLSLSGRFEHFGSDGSTSHARVMRAGYNTCLTAENLAWGYPTSWQIISGWMNSAGHRRNMLNPRVAEFGIGIAQGPRGPIWVLVLARGC